MRRPTGGRSAAWLLGTALAVTATGVAAVAALGDAGGGREPLAAGRPAGISRPAPAPVPAVPATSTSSTAPSGPAGAADLGPVASGPRAAALRSALRAALGNQSGCAWAESGGRLLAAVGGDAALAPASTQKLLTAAAALSVLGPGHRFVTRVMAPVPPHGGTVARIWLVGSGDPVLSSDAWMGVVLTHSHVAQPPTTPLSWLARDLRAAGITSVPGGISGDDSLYPDVRWLPTWKPVYLSEGDVGPLSALSVDEGWRQFRRAWVPAADPPAHAADLLSADLRRDGTAVGGVAPDGPPPPGAVTVATVTSPPLADIVAYMLATSDNHVAELLARAVGLAVSGRGTTAAGTRAILGEAARLGIPTAGAVMVDGSGLSPQNRATCAELMAAFRVGTRPGLAAMRWGVPVAGHTGTLYDTWRGTALASRVVAKTGWIAGAAGIVGNVAGAEPVDFAFLVNGRFNYGPALAMEGRALTALARYADGAPAG